MIESLFFLDKLVIKTLISYFSNPVTMFAGLKYVYHRWEYRDIYAVRKEIENILQDNNLDFYIITDVKRRVPWGYSIVISLNGHTFKKLEEIKENIETKLGYSIFIEQNENILKIATINIIVNKLTDNTKFIPLSVKPYELYLGRTYTMKDIVVSMRELLHVLYSGINNSGKIYCVITALTNLIYYHDASLAANQLTPKLSM